MAQVSLSEASSSLASQEIFKIFGNLALEEPNLVHNSLLGVSR